jgi:hypothetical protein
MRSLGIDSFGYDYRNDALNVINSKKENYK